MHGDGTNVVDELYPSLPDIDMKVPDRPREFLRQAQESLGQPMGSIMLSAGAVDAMLKVQNYTEGSLYTRIDKSAEDNLITAEMAQWAHQIRLDANDQRHADEAAPLPTMADAQLCLDFALALGEVFFVLPARVTRGLTESGA